ncbi:MAG: TonB-dependent receptor, partial [Hyphomonadaceae bacterium]
SMIGDWGFAGLAVKQTETQYGLPGHDHAHSEEQVGEEHADEGGPYIDMRQTRVELRGDRRIDVGPFDRLDFGFQHSDYEHTEFEAPGEPGTRFFSTGVEARFEAHHRGGPHEGVTGVQYSDVDFEAVGDEAFINASNTRDVGLFAVERWDQGGWGLEGGLRYERREIDNADFGERSFDNLSGSAGVFVRPIENWFLGATLARTERAPTAIELFADGPHLATANYEIGNPNLSQETALSFEASARYDSGPLRFEVNGFHVSFDDYIALVERGDFWWLDEETETSGFAPADDDPSIPDEAEVLPVFNMIQRDATFTGGEVSLRAQLFEAAGLTFSGDAAIDYVRAEFDGGGAPPRIPPLSATLGLEAENERWSGRIEVVDTAEQDRTAALESPTDGYTFVNAGLGFRPFGGDRLVVRIDGRNLTDEEGRVHSSFLKDELPLPGRSVRLTLTTAF